MANGSRAEKAQALSNQRVKWWGWGRLELPTYGFGIQRAVLIGVENF
jgi:hypothetical protein